MTRSTAQRTAGIGLLVGLILGPPDVPAGAQTGGAMPPPAIAVRPGPAGEQGQSRYPVSVMEGVLESAVEHGADVLTRRLRQSLPVPDMVMLTGTARAKGFRLDGYGMFFDVEVPTLRRSVAWSFRQLDQNDLGLQSALAALRSHIEQLGDSRKGLEQALQRVELQIGPVPAPAIAGVTAGPTGARAMAGSAAALPTMASGVSRAAVAQVAPQPRVPLSNDGLMDDPDGACAGRLR